MRQWCLPIALLLTFGLGAAQRKEDPGTTYTGVGPGHYIRTVSPDGEYITLEDRSNWQIDPRVRFTSKEWQPDAGISVRRAEPDNGYQ